MLITMFDKRTLLSREVHDEVKNHYPTIVLNTTIPRTVKISEAPSFNQSVIAYDPKGMGAIAYCEAALEIARRSQTVLKAIDARRNETDHGYEITFRQGSRRTVSVSSRRVGEIGSATEPAVAVAGAKLIARSLERFQKT